MGCKREDLGRHYATQSNHYPDLYVQTLTKMQKHFRRVQPHKMLQKFSFNMTIYDHTSLKIQEAITNLKWAVLPHTQYSPDLAS